MKEVTSIPNLPEMHVAVRFKERVKHPAGDRLYDMVFVGASARHVSAEAVTDEAEQEPISWRFLRGLFSGGDDPDSEPPWFEKTFRVDSDEKDAIKRLEYHLGGEQHVWFLMPETV